MQNIFEDMPETLEEESFETILEREGVIVERIVSKGQATPPGEWLSQERDEWVILLSGEADISFQNETRKVKMTPGSYIFIEARRRHRVEWTAPGCRSVWLAFHLKRIDQ